MIGRFSQRDIYREIFLTREFFIVLITGAVAIAACLFPQIPPKIATALIFASALINGGPIIIGSIKGLLKKRFNVDELVATALVISLIIGDFFEAAVIALVMRVGELIEEAVSDNARGDITALFSFLPQFCRRVDFEGQPQAEVPLDEVRPGDRLLVRAGEKIPVDGVVRSGCSGVDESFLTGESLPAQKEPGSKVLSGSLNGDGNLIVEVEKCGENSRLAKIIATVEQAEKTRPRVTRLVDRFARFFTPIIISAALLTYLLTGQIDRAVTVLLVGCPCALILIAPLGSLAASGRAAAEGALLKGNRLIENIASIKSVYFDKTGTITGGKPEVMDVLWLDDGDKERIISIACSLESHSGHPIARGIVAYGEKRRVELLPVESVVNRPGVGIEGRINGDLITISRELESDIPNEQNRLWLEDGCRRGYTPVFVRRNNSIAAIFLLGDRLRPESGAVIAWLRKKNITDVAMLSGDHPAVVQAIGKEISLMPAIARLQPEQKAEYIVQHGAAEALFVGDGLNDAVALTASGVGIAMDNGDGLDAALESAAAVMIGGPLWKVPFLFRLSRRVTSLMKLDIFFAFAFNALAAVLAAMGYLNQISGAIMHNIGAVIVASSFVVGLWGINVRGLAK